MKSPCVGICKLEGSTCIGCLRSIEEIEAWASNTREEKEELLNDLRLRRLKVDDRVAEV